MHSLSILIKSYILFSHMRSHVFYDPNAVRLVSKHSILSRLHHPYLLIIQIRFPLIMDASL